MFKTLMRDDVLNNGKQMKDVWNLNLTKPNKKKHEKHPLKNQYLF